MVCLTLKKAAEMQDRSTILDERDRRESPEAI